MEVAICLTILVLWYCIADEGILGYLLSAKCALSSSIVLGRSCLSQLHREFWWADIVDNPSILLLILLPPRTITGTVLLLSAFWGPSIGTGVGIPLLVYIRVSVSSRGNVACDFICTDGGHAPFHLPCWRFCPRPDSCPWVGSAGSSGLCVTGNVFIHCLSLSCHILCTGIEHDCRYVAYPPVPSQYSWEGESKALLFTLPTVIYIQWHCIST